MRYMNVIKTVTYDIEQVWESTKDLGVEYHNDCTHDWEFLLEPYNDTMKCIHCGVLQK